jgi:hypothetical protein
MFCGVGGWVRFVVCFWVFVFGFWFGLRRVFGGGVGGVGGGGVWVGFLVWLFWCFLLLVFY